MEEADSHPGLIASPGCFPCPLLSPQCLTTDDFHNLKIIAVADSNTRGSARAEGLRACWYLGNREVNWEHLSLVNTALITG